MEDLWIIAAVVASIAALMLALSLITYRLVFYNKHKEDFDPLYTRKKATHPFADRSNEMIRSLMAEPFEAVEIKARDGKRLVGRYYHRRDGAPLDIMFHGYKSGALHDFPGGVSEALAAGHNVLLVDQRGHGGSHGKTVAFGIKERFDCVDWARYAARRFGNGVNIILVGISMGAATVLYASELELPDQVCGIIADCPFSSAEEVMYLYSYSS